MDVYFQYEQILNEWHQLQEIMNQFYSEWKIFLESGSIKPNSQLSPEILSSWHRCRERGQDPFNTDQIVLSKERLEEEIHDHENLIKAAAPIANEIVEEISSMNFCLDLYSSNLYLINRFKRINKNRQPFDKIERRDIPVGVSNKEKDSGTTAVNMAALLKRPVRLVAYEHYSTNYHNISTLAAPILDVNGELIGVLATENLNWPVHRHTMPMLVSAKYNIEENLKHNIRNSSVVKLKNTFDSFFKSGFAECFINTIETPTIVIDADYRLCYISEEAKDMLNIPIANPIGFRCEEIWGHRNPFITTNRLYKFEKRNTSFDFDNKKVPILITPIYDNENNFFGLAGFLKNKKEGLCNNNSKNAKFRAYYTFENLIGEDPTFLQAIKIAKEVAHLKNNVLIQGESGTGKELFAQSIHNYGPCNDGPFVAVNCSAIPQTLLESELFGYEGGSFTGSKREGSIGKFEQANGGTIFLDEINSMPIKMQAAILRVIQTKKIVRVGGSNERMLNCRILAASNVSLWNMVKEGTFREDLYYRINVTNLNIPPLRQRKNDIELLFNHFIQKLEGACKGRLSIEKEALSLIKSYPWPGNIRELENVLERSCILVNTRGECTIRVEDLVSYDGIREFLNSNYPQQILLEDKSKQNPTPLSKLISTEKSILVQELECNGYNISRTAKKLNISRTTLYRKLKKFNIDIKSNTILL